MTTKPKDTLKDKLVDLIRAEGYDFMTASALATDCINRFKASGKKSERFFIGRAAFTLRK